MCTWWTEYSRRAACTSGQRRTRASGDSARTRGRQHVMLARRVGSSAPILSPSPHLVPRSKALEREQVSVHPKPALNQDGGYISHSQPICAQRSVRVPWHRAIGNQSLTAASMTLALCASTAWRSAISWARGCQRISSRARRRHMRSIHIPALTLCFRVASGSLNILQNATLWHRRAWLVRTSTLEWRR